MPTAPPVKRGSSTPGSVTGRNSASRSRSTASGSPGASKRRVSPRSVHSTVRPRAWKRRAAADADEAVARPLLAALDGLEQERSGCRRRAGGTARAACRDRRGSRAPPGSGCRSQPARRTRRPGGGSRLPRAMRGSARASLSYQTPGSCAKRRAHRRFAPPVFPDRLCTPAARRSRLGAAERHLQRATIESWPRRRRASKGRIRSSPTPRIR